MAYRILADLVVGVHALFVVFVMAGGLLALRWPRAHLPAAVWGTVIELRGWICPLTPLEKSLRASAGQAGYQGGFHRPPRACSSCSGFLVIVVNVVVYGLLMLRRRARAAAKTQGPSLSS
jgi:hypothetical protein